MDFEFTDDQLALLDGARSVLASACPPALVRSVHDGQSGDGPAGLWSTLCELDWPGIAVAESSGGLGLGFVEAGIVTEELGRVAAPVPWISTVMQYGSVLRLSGDAARLAAVASGSVTGTFAVAEGGRWEPAAVRTTAVPAADGSGGWVLSGTKSHVLDGATAGEIAVVARAEVGLGVFAVPGGAAGLSATPIDVIDPTQPVANLRFDDVAVGADGVLVAPGDPGVDDLLARALDESTVAVTLSTVAACRTIFEMTVQYAKDREQFGRPIGSFQAVKHRLADCFLAVERASALAWFAALTIAEDDPRRSLATSMAKSAAGDCQRLLSKDGLQLHGGVGFTWEHDLHFWLKRAVAGELLFGTSTWHRARVAELLGLHMDWIGSAS